MNINPKISIVIPVYNGSNFLSEAIDSALAQTYKNVEIVVVNDGSDDGGKTEIIARSYGEKIRYFSKENGGCASALNLGIRNMKGEYFSWLSHDDMYYPEKIEHQIHVLNSLSDRSTIIYSGYEIIDTKSRTQYSIRPDEVLLPRELNISLLPLLRGLIHGCTLLVPAKYFYEIGLFNEKLPTTQDYALWFEFLRVAPIYYDPYILTKSRIHPEQGTHKVTGHLDECNELWSSFLKRLSDKEMIEMKGSPYRFLSTTADFLETTPYRQAEKIANEMADDVLKQIKISVIMPVYNRIGWALEAARSVLEQDHSAFELIIIDDGSTEEVLQLLKLSETDSRVFYFRQENKGPAAARNFGISKASGKYIAFIDADDLFYPNKLKTQLKFMEENNALFSHTSYHTIDVNGKIINKISSGIFSGNVFPEIIVSCPIAMPTVMTLSSLFEKKFFQEYINIGEDVCLWIDIASSNVISGLDLALSEVRIHGNNATFDFAKRRIGLINIASFLVNSKYCNQLNKEINQLLTLAISYNKEILPISSPRNILLPKLELPNTAPIRLIKMAIKSFKAYGIRVTIHRIYRWIRIRI